jgi:nucleolar protein 53
MVPGFTRSEILNPSLTYRADKDKRGRRGAVDSKRPLVLAVAPARQGQSYNPDFDSHQQMLGVAVSAEIRRDELVKWEKEPLGNGMSEETMAILRSDSESSEDESEGEGEIGRVGNVVKREKKKTKADRNRQKRHKERMRDIQDKKR